MIRNVPHFLPQFHEAQIEIARDDHRFKVIAAGRRFGKGTYEICNEFRMASRGAKCRWVAPSYSSDSYQAGWRIATNLANQVTGCAIHLQRREFNFSRIGGGWLQFRTAEEPNALRGEGIDHVAFDEAAHIENLEDIWEQSVRPSLMDRRGSADFIGTPFGFNYFNTLFLRGRDRDDWRSFQFPTSANPHIAQEEIDELRASLPALVARQEIDAEFVQLAGALFKRQNIRVLEELPSGLKWVRSWDLAYSEKTVSDATAGAMVGVTDDATVVIADVVGGRMEWPDAVRLMANTARLDGPGVRQGVEVGSLQSAANAAVQQLMSDPLLLQYSFTPINVHRDKITRALPLIARCEQGKFAIVRGAWNQAFIDELCAFPEGKHDDQVDAASGGMQLLSLPTGAIDSRSIAHIGVGPNTQGGGSRHFVPRRLVPA